MSFTWTCPFCNRGATIVGENFSRGTHEFSHGNKHGVQKLITTVIVCPNPECNEYVLQAYLYDMPSPNLYISSNQEPKDIWQLIPAAEMQVFPSYVPAPIISDYKEACLIRDLSPKASATLSRRCLQGMIRDFWGIKKPRLVDEIDELEQRVDPLTWSAIDAVRKIGNIGAHMEKDINVIIDVDPEEAKLLIGLIEMLIKDWYITKHERAQQMSKIIAAAGAKTQAKAGGTATPATVPPANKP